MSLASLMSSYDPARQFGNVTAGTVTTTDSLTVKGVPITGLLSSGAPESAYSAQTFVQTLGDVSSNGLYGTSSLELTKNSYSQAASFEDVVTVDASGAWSYPYPVLFSSPPTLELIAAGGSAGPLLDSCDVSGASGYLRYATSQSKFIIRGSGSYVSPTSTYVPQLLHPSIPLTSDISASVFGTNVLRVAPFGGFTTPADLDPTKACEVTASWAPVVAWNTVGSFDCVLLMSTAPITSVSQPAVNAGWWKNIPSSTPTAVFASQSWNQYLNTSVKLLPNTLYYV